MQLMLTSFGHAVTLMADPWLMLIVFIGLAWGIMGGALPGVGQSLILGIALPFTFGMTPVQAIAFLVAANLGSSYGNSIPAVLLGVPGKSSAALTALDGYALHKKGETGLALAVQYYASMFGALSGIPLFLIMVVPLASLAYVFLSPEMFALILLGMTAVISLTSENLLKGFLSVGAGFALSMIGQDPVSGQYRFAYTYDMRYGLSVTPIIIGCLAVGVLLRELRQSYKWGGQSEFSSAWKFPPLKTLWKLTPMVIMGSVIGQISGVLPGIGGNVGAFVAYNQAKLLSKNPREFGHGSTQGIAANEAAQAADQIGELVPTFGLGIPGSGSMVMLFSAMLMHGFIPGPKLITDAPQMLDAATLGLLASTLILILIGWPICGLILRVVSFDRTVVMLGALALCMLGAFTLERSTFDVFLVVLFGAIGYFMSRYGYSPAGLAIGLVLGTDLEGYLRRGLLLMDSDWVKFVTRPWTAALLLVSLAMLVYGLRGAIRLSRETKAIRQRALAKAQAAAKAAPSAA